MSNRRSRRGETAQMHTDRRQGHRPVASERSYAEGWPRAADANRLHVMRAGVLSRIDHLEAPVGTEERRAAYLAAVMLGLQRVRARVAVTPLPESRLDPT